MLDINESCFSHLNTISGGRNFENRGDITGSVAGTDLDREEKSKNRGKMAPLAPLGFATVSCSGKCVYKEPNLLFFSFFPPGKNLLTQSLAFWFLSFSIMDWR